MIEAYARLSLFFAILEIKYCLLEIPVYEYGNLGEKVAQSFFAQKPNLTEVLKECAVYLKGLIEKNFETRDKQELKIDCNPEDGNQDIISENSLYYSKSNLDKGKKNISKIHHPESCAKQTYLKLFTFMNTLLHLEGYQSLQLAAEFKEVFNNPDGNKLKKTKKISIFNRLEKHVLVRIELEQLLEKFQSRLDTYLFKLSEFVGENDQELLNLKPNISDKIKDFHDICKNTLVCGKKYMEKLLLNQKELLTNLYSNIFSITENQELLSSSTTIKSNQTMTPLIDIFHFNNIFGLSVDYLNFDLTTKYSTSFLQNLISLIPKKIIKPLISVPTNQFSIFSLKDKQRVSHNKLILQINIDLESLRKYLKNQSDTIPSLRLTDLLKNRIPKHWSHLVFHYKIPGPFKDSSMPVMDLKAFLLHLNSYYQSIFTSQKQINNRILNMKQCANPFRLIPSLQYKFNKYHSRYIFPLEFSISCYSPSQINMYLESSKASDESGLFGFSISECNFHRTEQKLVSCPKSFKNEWLALLFPQDKEEAKSEKNLQKESMNVITQQMNVLRVKMTHNIYIPTLEQKFIKENPIEKFIFDKNEHPSEEFCIPIYIYLNKKLRFKLGYAAVERGDKSIEHWLTSDVKIKCT